MITFGQQHGVTSYESNVVRISVANINVVVYQTKYR